MCNRTAKVLGLAVILHFAFCILHLAAQPTNRTPLNRAFLQSNADGNRYAWTNLSRLTATGDVVAVVFTGSGSNLTDIVAASTNAAIAIKSEGVSLAPNATSIDVTNNPNDSVEITATATGNAVTFGVRGDPTRKSMFGAPDVIWYTGGAGDWEDAASMQAMLVLHQWGRLNLRGVGLGTGGWRMLSGTNRIDDASIEAMSTLADYYRVNPGEVPFALYTNSTWGFLPVYSNAVPPIRYPKLYTQYMTNKGFARLKQPNYPTTLKMFRKQLALAETNSLWFAINHPIQPLTELFDSPADEISPLNGADLFNSRVHQVSSMSGDFPYCTVVNGEYNISTSTGAAYSNIIARITRPITWIGFGIGRTVVSSSEPQHIKSMSQGWRLLSTANPLYDLTYQATTTGDAGRAAWGGIHAAIIGLGSARYYISNSAMTNIQLTIYSNVFTTNTVVIDPVADQDVTNQIPAGTYTGVVQNTSNITVNLFGFVTTGTNRILANGSNYWHQDNIDHGQRYLSYINTNYAQYFLDQVNYTREWDPPVFLFNNSDTNNLGIGTASAAKRVHMQFPNASIGFYGDNNYAKIRFGLNLTTDYAEMASQGQDTLFSAGSKTNSGTPQPGAFEFYRRTFDVGGPGLIGRTSTNGGWWFGGFPSDLLEMPILGEVYAAKRVVTPIVALTNWVNGFYIIITETNINLNGNAIDSWNDVTNFFTQIGGGGGGGATNAVNTIKEGGVQVGGSDITSLDFLGADFDVTEVPDQEINITISSEITRTSQIDTIGEIEAITGVNILVSTEVDSVAELETLVSANLLISTELDTSTELFSLLTDETGTGKAVANTNASLSGTTLNGFTTNKNVTASSLMGVDANQVETNIVLGAGLSLAGGVLTASVVTTNAVNVLKENGSQLGDADITTLDFLGVDFDLTESPDKEVNISIASGITRDAEWDTESEVEAIWGVNILKATEIDTSSELLTILTDETGIGKVTGSTNAVVSDWTMNGSNDIWTVSFKSNVYYPTLTAGTYVTLDSNGKLISTTDGSSWINIQAPNLQGIVPNASIDALDIVDLSAAATNTIFRELPGRLFTSTSSSNLNWAYTENTCIVRSNWTATEVIAPATTNQNLWVTYTNPTDVAITLTLPNAYAWLNYNSEVSASLSIAGTNVTRVRYWVDGGSTRNANIETTVPNLQISQFVSLVSTGAVNKILALDGAGGLILTNDNNSGGGGSVSNAIAFTLNDPIIGQGNGALASTNKTAFLNLFGNGALILLSTNDGSALTNLDGSDIASGTVADARIASTITRDTEWDTIGEIETAIGSLNIILATEIDTSSELAGIVGDETGTGVFVLSSGASITNPIVKNSLQLTNDGVSAGITMTTNGVTWTNGGNYVKLDTNGVTVAVGTNSLVQLYDNTGTNWSGLAPASSMGAGSNYTLRLPISPTNTAMAGMYATNSGTGWTNVQMKFNYLWFTNVTLNFPQITANSSTNLNFTAPGATTNSSVVSIVTVNPYIIAPWTNKVFYTGFITNIAGTTECVIQACNFSAGNVDPPSGALSVKIEQFGP